MNSIEFCIIVIGLVLVFIVGRMNGTDTIKEEAVKAGVAEYYIGADNDKLFRWKTSDIKK